MSKVLQRMKGILNKKPNSRPKPSGPPPNRQGNQAPIGTITKPPSPTDDDDDDGASVGNYNVPEQTQLKGQERNTMNPQRNTSPPERNNNPPAPQRNNAPPERNNNPPAPQRNNAPPERNNTNTVPQRNAAPPERNNTNTVPQRNAAPPERNNTNTVPQRNAAPPERNNNQATAVTPAPQRNAAPPERNNNQPIVAPPPPPNASNGPSGINANQTTSPMNSFFSGMNVNSASPPPLSTINNSQSPPAGFPSNFNTNKPSTNDSNNYMGTKQLTSFPQRGSSFRTPQHDDDTLSRLELDYPIENVLIDANIPSAIAVKINDVVEQDRLGNNYHVHRYTYEPSSQQISYDNHNQYQPPHHNDQHSGDKTHRRGTRHIREIYHNNQNPLYDDLTSSHVNHQPSRTPHNRHRYRTYSDVPLDQYIDQLLRTPGSTVIQAQNSDDLQQIFGQYMPNNLLAPTQSSLSPLQSNNIPYPEPIAYYTAQALPNDPMRNY
ncbi:hypothetical protein I4U23_008522 [Adineta vaga]|nr:hypothetical protein I4U23_008522 [Adineta vaga]